MRGATIEAVFDLCSPLFLGGGDTIPGTQIRNFRLSAAPFVAAIRFWWRALAWSHRPKDKDDKTQIAWLKNEEAALFGSAESGQGAFLVQRIEIVGGERRQCPPPTDCQTAGERRG